MAWYLYLISVRSTVRALPFFNIVFVSMNILCVMARRCVRNAASGVNIQISCFADDCVLRAFL